jgi:hypothetical protein
MTSSALLKANRTATDGDEILIFLLVNEMIYRSEGIVKIEIYLQSDFLMNSFTLPVFVQSSLTLLAFLLMVILLA